MDHSWVENIRIRLGDRILSFSLSTKFGFSCGKSQHKIHSVSANREKEWKKKNNRILFRRIGHVHLKVIIWTQCSIVYCTQYHTFSGQTVYTQHIRSYRYRIETEKDTDMCAFDRCVDEQLYMSRWTVCVRCVCSLNKGKQKQKSYKKEIYMHRAWCCSFSSFFFFLFIYKTNERYDANGSGTFLVHSNEIFQWENKIDFALEFIAFLHV